MKAQPPLKTQHINRIASLLRCKPADLNQLVFANNAGLNLLIKIIERRLEAATKNGREQIKAKGRE